MRIDLGNVEINRLAGDPVTLWSMPNYPNMPTVDMADPNPNVLQPIPAPEAVIPGQPQASSSQWRQR